VTEPVIIGRATLYLGDCRDVLPTLPVFDLLCTDPPYGIGESGGKARTRGKSEHNHPRLEWDNEVPSGDLFSMLFDKSLEQAIFGANYFTHHGLPPRMGWLYWDKMMGGDFSDGELIFTSRIAALKAIRIPQNSVDRVHPTQKPLAVMKAVLNYFPNAQTILDPFMGSGSTGCAAVQMGRSFVGVEREPTYFEVACKRIEQAQRQGDFFVEAA
jgi:site-specific DNA-methyltransferase (adenine-specific)